jgi:hypothetical protein
MTDMAPMNCAHRDPPTVAWSRRAGADRGSKMLKQPCLATVGKSSATIVWFARLRESNVVVRSIDDVLLTERIHSRTSLLQAWPIYKRELMQQVQETLLSASRVVPDNL